MSWLFGLYYYRLLPAGFHVSVTYIFDHTHVCIVYIYCIIIDKCIKTAAYINLYCYTRVYCVVDVYDLTHVIVMLVYVVLD